MNGPFRFPVRPGGFAITQEALALCAFPRGARLLDIGCGFGATVQALNKQGSYQTWGIDRNPAVLAPLAPITRACATRLPFKTEQFDGALMECTLSAMDDPDTAVDECFRVLKKGGGLILSDVYARGEPAQLRGCLARVDSQETIRDRLLDHGLVIEKILDQSHHLRAQWAQMVFDHGLSHFCSAMGSDPCTLKKIRCGYILFIARKPGAPS